MTINFAAIFVAKPDKKIDENTTQQLAKLLGSTQIESLHAGRAVRILCEQPVAIPAELGLDIFFRPYPLSPVKLLVCDMESTIVNNEFLDEIADYLGIGEKVAKITARAMNGELDFEAALKERINLIEGLSLAEAETILQTRLQYNTGAKELIRGCKEQGIHCALVSGGFTMFTKAVKEELGFDEHHANELLFTSNKLTGVGEPILGKEAKLEYLQKQVNLMRIDISQTITMGDGANDLPMLHAAGMGVAYVGKPKVKAEIFSQINSGDLSSLLLAL